MAKVLSAPTYASGKQFVPANGGESPLEARGAALLFLQQLAKEVTKGTVDLPCFPDVVIKVRNALADSETTPQQTVQIVGAEPRLAAKLLQTANSAALNPSGKPVTGLRAAITRLGHQMVQSAAMAFAVQQIRDEESLRPIAPQLSELWKNSIAVASICQVVARRTKINPDEAFLAGLLHGIGRLYILARAVGAAKEYAQDAPFMRLIAGWHAAIGKAVLETWGFAPEVALAVNDQADYERKFRREAELSDVLIVSIILAEALQQDTPRSVDMLGIAAFQTVGVAEQDCATILSHAEHQLGSLQDALGC